MTDDTAKATLSLRRMRIPISCAMTGPSRRIKRAGPPWTPLTESPFVGQAEATGRRAGEGPHRFRERPLPRRQPSPAAAGLLPSGESKRRSSGRVKALVDEVAVSRQSSADRDRRTLCPSDPRLTSERGYLKAGRPTSSVGRRKPLSMSSSSKCSRPTAAPTGSCARHAKTRWRRGQVHLSWGHPHCQARPLGRHPLRSGR